VFLLDHSGKSLNLMKDWAVENRKHVVLIKADAEALPFKNQCFDVVFHQGLLEHFPNPKPILRENYRVLSVGGILLVDVPQTFHVYTIIKHLLISFNAWFAGWETQFTVSELGRLVCSVGLKVRNFYGDWMHPSLMYRLLRELLLKIGLRIPMYPKGFGVTRAVLKMMLRVLDRFPVFLYTCLDIGVVAEKLSEKRS
jgi:SAM-dependent methyltransferase